MNWHLLHQQELLEILLEIEQLNTESNYTQKLYSENSQFDASFEIIEVL
jgi:hypothetical protein